METGMIPNSLLESLPFIIPFGFIGVWRWGLYLLRLFFWACYKPIHPKKNGDAHGGTENRYKTSDVTIVVPTIDNGPEFITSAQLWKKNKPYEVIIVTSKQMEAPIRESCRQIDPDLFRVLTVDKPNKRVQLMKGVHASKTDIIALSDDDAIWTDEFLLWMLAPFDDDRMGGVGSHQEMQAVGSYETVWEVIADFRLTMRMIETSATTFVDGGMSCLSGRTAVYRREILQDPAFEAAFVNEKWLGKYSLHSGDDKFITRWLVKHGWNMQMQNHPESSLKTTFKNDSRFVKQVLRWTRNTWRSDIRSCFVDRAIWRRHPYVAFNMLDKFINPFPLLYGLGVIIYNLVKHGSISTTYVVLPVMVWLLVSRLLRLIPHLIKKPHHVVYVPAMILFQYYFNVLKIYALFTLHITDWGSRESADDQEDDCNTAAECEMDSQAFSKYQRNGDSTGNTSRSDVTLPMADSNDNTTSTESATPFKELYSTMFGSEAIGWLSKKTASFESASFEDSESNSSKSAPAPKAANMDTDHPFLPWYRRPSVIIGGVWFVLVLLATSYLVTVAIEYDPDWKFWTISSLATQHALSSDRATGVAIYDSEVDQTFVVHSGPNMNPRVMTYDHGNKTLLNYEGQGGVFAGQSHPTLYDYHDYPKMVVAQDGHLVVTWTNHPGGLLWVSRSQNPHSAEGDWSQQLIPVERPTYPCMLQDAQGAIYIWYRTTISSDYRPQEYIKSTDNGLTWSSPRRIIDSGGFDENEDPTNVNEVYAGCPRILPPETEGGSERFAFGWTMSGGGPGTTIHNNYHKDAHFVYFSPATETFSTVDGRDLGAMISYDELPYCVVESSGPLDENNKHPVDYYFAPSYISGSNLPIIVYNHNRTLTCAQWDGSQWHYSIIAKNAAKALFDLEKTGPNEFRLFHASGDDIVVYTSSNGGKSWKKDRESIPTRGLGGSVNKVMLVENSRPDLRLIAMETDFSERDYTGKYQVYGIGENLDTVPGWRRARTPQ